MFYLFILEQRRRRKEWKRNKVAFEVDKSEAENTKFARPSLNAVNEGLIDSASDDDEAAELPDKPNLMLATGKKLIPPLSNKFCAKRHTGVPLQEMDDFYRYKNVSLFTLWYI